MESFLAQIKSIVSTLNTDTIFIIGKGSSIDEVDPKVFSNSLVIGINDAERINPCDITIFHDQWVSNAIKENGFQSKLYITSVNFNSPDSPVLHAKYIPASQENTDIMMQRLVLGDHEDELILEEVQFISALKLARQIACHKKRKLKVYMVGFDFSTEAGYSVALGKDYSPMEVSGRSARINPQEYYFINSLYMLNDSEIKVFHVGTHAFSTLTPSELNRQYGTQTLNSTNAKHNKVIITAELTTNHFGDRARLESMVRLAHTAGATLIKVQKRDIESFYTQEQLDGKYISPFGKTFRDYRNALELSLDDFEFLDNLCQKLEIKWFASILDKKSFHFILNFKPKLIKLPSTISEHTDYLDYIAKNYHGSVVLSTGMTDHTYEKWILETFTRCEKLYLMQCNSAYPTPDHDCNIGVIRHYRDLSKKNPYIIPAYSSHDIGSIASSLAVSAGAKMIEKHVKLGNTDWAHFDAVAMDLTTTDFSDFVSKIRKTEEIIGLEEKRVNSSEHHKYFIKG